MEFGQLIEYNVGNILQKTCRKWGREASSDVYLFFKKLLYEVKVWNYKTSDCLVCNMLSFDFLKKGPGLVFQPHFVYFCKKNIFHVIFLID